MSALQNYHLKATQTQSAKAYRAKLQSDIKRLTSLLKALDAEIHAGGYSDQFDLVPAPVTMFVPKDEWVAALGEEWVAAHEVPMNKKPVIKAK